jgi:hypothetical protein
MGDKGKVCRPSMARCRTGRAAQPDSKGIYARAEKAADTELFWINVSGGKSGRSANIESTTWPMQDGMGLWYTGA